MRDKTKVYMGFSKPYSGKNQSSSKRFKRIRILYEDDISFYVESLIEKDSIGFGKRYSVKKHQFHLIEVSGNRLPETCKLCPLYQASVKFSTEVIQ